MKTLIVAIAALSLWWFGYAIGSQRDPEQRAAHGRITVELQSSEDGRDFHTICASGEPVNKLRIVSKEGPVDIASDIFEPWRD